MISLLAMDQLHTRVLPVVTPEDEKLSRVLDCATFYRWRRNDSTGANEAWFRLIKPLPGYAVGSLIELSKLHEALFGTPLRNPNT
jgi:hypothetical protein